MNDCKGQASPLRVIVCGSVRVCVCIIVSRTVCVCVFIRLYCSVEGHGVMVYIDILLQQCL